MIKMLINISLFAKENWKPVYKTETETEIS